MTLGIWRQEVPFYAEPAAGTVRSDGRKREMLGIEYRFEMVSRVERRSMFIKCTICIIDLFTPLLSLSWHLSQRCRQVAASILV